MTNHAGPIIAERDGLRVCQCSVCGFAHADPLPDARALDAYYKSSFWATKGKGWLLLYEAQRDWMEMRDGDVLSVIETHTLGRTLLDVGAAHGFFVGTATARGWQAVGIDPSREASDYARAAGRNVQPDTWEDFWPSRYDAITAFWLLEHLPNAFDFLRFCRRHLYTGGTLCLAVPNEFSWGQMMVNSRVGKPWYWVHETHTNYFTPATLGNLLGRAGFRVVDLFTSYQMETFLLDGQDYTVDEALGSACHAKVRAAELAQTRQQRLELAREHGRMGVGRDLFVVAKPE